MLQNTLVANQHAFPQCYSDHRYGRWGRICKPEYTIVNAGFHVDDPFMLFPSITVKYRNEGGMWVRAGDASYLRNKWYPEGGFNLIEMDISTATLRPRVVGDYDHKWQGGWNTAEGTWITPAEAESRGMIVDGPRHRAVVSFTYKDNFDGKQKVSSHYSRFPL